MKKIITTILLIFIIATSFAQVKHNKFSTVITFDMFNPAAYFYNTSVSEIKDNSGYFLTNRYDDQANGFSPSLVKLDVDGNLVFDSIYNFMTIYSTGYTSIVNTTSTATEHTALYLTTSSTVGGLASPYILNFDVNGNINWHFGYSNDTLDLEPQKLINTADGGYLIAGKMYDWVNSVSSPAGFAIKLDNAGIMQWHKLYTNKDTMNLIFSDAIQTKDKGFLFVGKSDNMPFSPKTLTENDKLITLVKTDSLGNMLWNKGVVFDAPLDNEVGYTDVSTGMINAIDAFVAFSVRDSSTLMDNFVIMSVNVITGAKNWTNHYTYPPSEIFSIRKTIGDGYGNIIVTGSDHNIGSGAIFKIDGQGVPISSKRFKLGSNGNFPYEMIKTLDGGFAHLSEIDQKNLLFVKTDKLLEVSCPDIDSSYYSLTAVANADTSYLNFVDSIYSMIGLNSIQLSMNSPITTTADDSLICSCANTITGTVWDGSTPAVNARVFLFKKGFVPKPWRAVDSTLSDLSGQYTFNYVATDSFLVKVHPDPILQPNSVISYHKEVGYCFKWDSAGVFHVHCDSINIVKDIDLINPPPLTGNSSLNGYVRQHIGGFNKAPGDPVPGIGITVEQSPGGVVGNSTSGGLGFYNFSSLNNSATYVISIDYPGLPNDSIYTMTINLNDTILDSLNFYIDSTGIYIVNQVGVGVNIINNYDLSVELFPNPSAGIFNLIVVATKTEEIELNLTNQLGQSISSKTVNLNKGENKVVLQTDELQSGIYFLKIKQGKNLYLKKLIKQ